MCDVEDCDVEDNSTYFCIFYCSKVKNMLLFAWSFIGSTGGIYVLLFIYYYFFNLDKKACDVEDIFNCRFRLSGDRVKT